MQANWARAAQYCRYHGMHLASVNTEEEQRQLEEHIQSLGEISICLKRFVRECVTFCLFPGGQNFYLNF